jgi:hypothetical protein
MKLVAETPHFDFLPKIDKNVQIPAPNNKTIYNFTFDRNFVVSFR